MQHVFRFYIRSKKDIFEQIWIPKMLRAKFKEWLPLVQWFLEDVENVKSLQTDRQQDETFNGRSLIKNS